VQHFDALHGVERNGNVAVVVSGLRVVQPNAVDEHQHLSKVRAAHGEIRLHAALAPRADVDRGHQSQDVGHGMCRKRVDLIAGDHGQRPRHAAELDRCGRRGHDDGLPEGALCRDWRSHGADHDERRADAPVPSGMHRGNVADLGARFCRRYTHARDGRPETLTVSDLAARPRLVGAGRHRAA
jgi:hypothetical protein